MEMRCRVVGCVRLLLAGAALLVPVAAQEAREAGAVQVKRPNLVVGDLDRSLRLYRDILGFTVFAVGESKPDSYSYPVFGFPPEARLRMATLSTKTQVRTLALTELRGAKVPPRTLPHRAAVVIEVKGIDRVIERIRAEGLRVVPATISKTPEGQTFVEQAFEDYDGHLIVLYEIRADAGGSAPKVP